MKITRAIAKRHIIHFILLVLLVVVDQLFKVWARGSLKGNEDITVIPGILSFSYLENRGAVWGIFQNKTTFLILLTAVIFVAVLVIYFKLPLRRSIILQEFYLFLLRLAVLEILLTA